MHSCWGIRSARLHGLERPAQASWATYGDHTPSEHCSVSSLGWVPSGRSSLVPALSSILERVIYFVCERLIIIDK